jgi:hypothetical protein
MTLSASSRAEVEPVGGVAAVSAALASIIARSLLTADMTPDGVMEKAGTPREKGEEEEGDRESL